MDFHKIFLARLHVAKGKMGITEFARKCGLSQPLMSMYFKGIRTPGAEHLRKICQESGVSADYLLGLSDVVSEPPPQYILKVAEPPPLDYMA